MLDYVGTVVSTAWLDPGLKRSHLTSSKLKVLADRIYAPCDETDGLKHGLIDDPRQCGYERVRKHMGAATDDVLRLF
jgi:hypothetical protein